MAELLSIREGQTLLRLTMRFPAGSLDGFNVARLLIKPPSGAAMTRDAELEFDAAVVGYTWRDTDPALATGLYTYIAELEDAEGRIARSRHAGRFRVVEEFAT